MVAGDAVIATSAPNTVLTFTPAAGVEVLITTCTLATAMRFLASTHNPIANAVTPSNLGAIKVWCNNANPLLIDAGGVGIITDMCGVQTK